MTAPRTSTRHVRVAFVGSSSVEARALLPAAIAAEIGLIRGEWIALGRRGAHLGDWIAPEWPADLTADAIVVLLTGNDAHPRADEVRAVDRALRTHARIVLWLPPFPYPAGSIAEGRDRRMREALAGAGVARVAVTIELARRYFAPDRVHLTRAGYEAYARQVGPALRRALGVRQPAEPTWSSSAIGTLVTGRGARLPLTSTDALWMARALVGEGGGQRDAFAITSTMLRRWALLWDGGERALRSLTDLVVGRFRGASPYDGDVGVVELRGYSQPVAVQWRTSSGDNAERRRRVRSLRWDEIDSLRRQAVLRLMTGRARLDAVPAVHFAERSVVEAGMRNHADWRLVSVPGALNVFVSTGGSRRMREPEIIGADRATPLEARRTAIARVADRDLRSPSPLLIGTAVAAVAALAFLANRPADPQPAEATP